MKIYLFILLLFCIYFVWSDLRKRLLHNKSLILFSAFQVIFLVHDHNFNFFSFVIVSSLGVIIYLFKVVAAGDIKLASIMSFSVVPNYLDITVLIMLFSGGALAVFYLIKHCFLITFQGESDVLQLGLPYGMPICFGFYIGTILSLIS